LHTDTQSGKETRPRGGDDTGKETEKYGTTLVSVMVIACGPLHSHVNLTSSCVILNKQNGGMNVNHVEED